MHFNRPHPRNAVAFPELRHAFQYAMIIPRLIRTSARLTHPCNHRHHISQPLLQQHQTNAVCCNFGFEQVEYRRYAKIVYDRPYCHSFSFTEKRWIPPVERPICPDIGCLCHAAISSQHPITGCQWPPKGRFFRGSMLQLTLAQIP